MTAYSRNRGGRALAAPRGWVGGSNGLSAKLSPRNGLGAEAPSQNPPGPRRSAPVRRNRPTARPAREPGLTGYSVGGVSPSQLRMATDPGTDAYRDRPRHSPRHSGSVLRNGAAGVRLGVGCGSSCVSRRLPADRPVGSPRIAFATAAVIPGPRRVKRLIVPGPAEYCLLTRKALWGFGPTAMRCPRQRQCRTNQVHL